MFRRNPTAAATTSIGNSLSYHPNAKSKSTTNAPVSPQGCYLFFAIMTIGLLLYIIFFQYLVIRSKESIILSLIKHPPKALTRYPCDSVGENSQSLPSRGQVGVFPRRKPSNRTVPLSWSSDWKPFSPKIRPRLSYPVFVTSLPKSGTTSIWKFFKCGQLLASHNWIQKVNTTVSTMAGKCIQQNILEGQPPFQDCGAYDVYTDTGYLKYDHDIGEQCYFPSIDGLDAIYESYPRLTIFHVVRNSTEWYHSLKNWSHSSLFVRFRLCNATGFPNGQSGQADFIYFYEQYNEMIRQFVAERPSITYWEVALEAAHTGSVLAEATGIPRRCWKHCKPQERGCQEPGPPPPQEDEQGVEGDEEVV